MHLWDVQGIGSKFKAKLNSTYYKYAHTQCNSMSFESVIYTKRWMYLKQPVVSLCTLLPCSLVKEIKLLTARSVDYCLWICKVLQQSQVDSSSGTGYPHRLQPFCGNLLPGSVSPHPDLNPSAEERQHSVTRGVSREFTFCFVLFSYF